MSHAYFFPVRILLPLSFHNIQFFHTSLRGVLVFGCALPPARNGRPARRPHTTCSHTTYSETTCPHTTGPHTTSSPHNLLTTQLNHTQLVHHTTCARPPPTHNLLTHNLLQTHNLCPPAAHTQLVSHTTCSPHHLSPHNFLTHGNLCHWAGSGGALVSRLAPWSPHTQLAWQAWQLVHIDTSLCVARVARPAWIVTLRGRRGTYGTGLAQVARLGLVWRRGRHRRLCGRHGTWRHGPLLCVARVALRDMDRHFASQAWHLWHWAGSMGLVWRRGCRRRLSTVTLRGRRGTSRHGSSLCVAGMALMALGWSTNNLSPHNLSTHNLLTHNLSPHNLPTHNLLTTPLVTTQLPHVQLVTTQLAHTQLTHTHNLQTHNLLTNNLSTHNSSTHNLLTHNLYLATWTCTLRRKRGTSQHGSSLCVAGVALIALGWLRWRAWVSFGTVVAAAVCVAGVVLREIDCHFAGQLWLFATWTCILRGRRC